MHNNIKIWIWGADSQLPGQHAVKCFKAKEK